MTLTGLALQITDNCPLQCAHCCVESGPWRTGTLTLEDAVSWVRQARAMSEHVTLSFTGGEPFVRYPLMLAIAREAWSLGMPHTTITSAVWCKSREFARERLHPLVEAGLEVVNISHDEFHLPWVDAEHVRACAEAAADLGLRITIGAAQTKKTRTVRELLGPWAETVPNLHLLDGAVAPNGRAALIPLEDLLFEDHGEQNLVCPSVDKLVIETDGSTYPCCSVGGDYETLKLGNAHETPLAELRRRAEHATWFQIITRDGFATLEQIVRRYDPELEFPRTHLGICHLCALVLGANDLGRRVRAALARYDADRATSAAGIFARLLGAAAGA